MARILIGLLCFILLQPAFAMRSPYRSFGDIGQIGLPVAGLVISFLHKDWEGSLQLTKAYAATLGTTFALKYAINRKRPDGGKHAFPSAHTASAFAGAAFLQQRYGWLYGIPAYAVAVAVGDSRVHANRHWVSDVVAGGLIGIGANLIFTTRFTQKHNIDVSPMMMTDEGVYPGLSIGISW